SAALAALRTASAAFLAALNALMASIVRLIALMTDGILPSLVHGIASTTTLTLDHMSPPKQAIASMMPMKSFSVSHATARMTEVRDLPIVALAAATWAGDSPAPVRAADFSEAVSWIARPDGSE